MIGATVASALLIAAPLNAAGADKEEKVSIRAFGVQPAYVAGHLKLDSNCQVREDPPQLTLLVPPDHGSVCTKADLVPARHDSHIGREDKCLGTTRPGLTVFYQPDGDYAGMDAFRYQVDAGVLFKVGRELLNVNVFVQSFSASNESLFAHRPQKPGPIPPCQTAVS